MATTILSRLTPSSLLLSRARMLGKFVSVQAVVQVLGFASGLLLVRALTQKEYAYFTIANSMQATMSILADSGVGIGLTSIGGKVWQDRRRFGELIHTALYLRRYLAAIAVTVVAPLLMWLLISNGASKTYAAIITLAVMLALNYQLLTGVLGVVPRLHSQIDRVQKLDALGAASRLLLLVAAYFVFLDAAVAIFIGIAGVFAQYVFLRRWAVDNIEPQAEINREDRASMLGIVKHQAPNAVFYCLQGQLTVWLISIFGNTQNIAEVGALGRLGMIFAIISAVMSSIVLPGFARCQLPSLLRRRYWQILSCSLLLGCCLVVPAVAFPDELLWILGNKYSHLTREVPLMVLGAVLSAIAVTMLSLNVTKGWVAYYWLNIPCLILLQTVLILVMDLSTIHSVLLFSIFSSLPGIGFSAVITWMKLFRTPLTS
jgi:O-antigen/teichoic acid export membrane protein